MNKRLIASILAAALILPTAAIAADMIAIDSKVYTQEEHPDGVSGDGSNSGTWSWDGKDELTLTDYDGGPVAARGDIEIKLEGENTVTSYNQDAVLVWGEDAKLTITGEGSLTADMTVDSEDMTHAVGVFEPWEDQYGIRCGNIHTIFNMDGGETEIRDTTVTAIARTEGRISDTVYSAIANYGGDLKVVNSELNVEMYVNNENAIYGYQCIDVEGKMEIDNSTVDITAVNLRDLPETARNTGIAVYDVRTDPDTPSLVINASTVRSSTNGQGIIVRRHFGLEGLPADKSITPGIVLKGGSELILPGDAKIIDFYQQTRPEPGNYWYISAIGYGEGPDERGLWDSDTASIAPNVLIEYAPEPEPEPAPAPTPEPEPVSAPAPATILPKTADAALVLEGSIAASGALLALAGILRRRR